MVCFGLHVSASLWNHIQMVMKHEISFGILCFPKSVMFHDFSRFFHVPDD